MHLLVAEHLLVDDVEELISSCSFYLVMHDGAHQTSVNASVQQHIVTGAMLQVNLK